MLLKKFIFCSSFLFLSLIVAYIIFFPLFTSQEVIITYGFHPFDICSKNPELWKYLKIIYIFTYVFSNLIISNSIFKIIIKLLNYNSKIKITNNLDIDNTSSLSLLIGFDKDTNSNIYIPETGLFQNFLVTGTIGSGKTSSVMYPFTRQFLEYNSKNPNNKIGMLILDVKGNYYQQVTNYCHKYKLNSDLIVLKLKSNIFYNPLHKPNLKPQVLANRLKTILTLFSENNTESYWLDKAEQILSECIKLCRLYNNGYVTFLEIHKLITMPDYYKQKINLLKELFISGNFTQSEIYELNSCLDFFQKEFYNLDSRTKAILVSEITRITNVFVSDYDIATTFCPPKNHLTFTGFKEIIQEGKIVVLNINISEYSMLSKIIAAYLKLDFQNEVMVNLSNNTPKNSVFICDEYDKYVTKTDSEFFSMSREAKCINIVSTQSYSSLKNTLKDETYVKVITQNLINKIWFRTDDIFTIEEAQKQLGKEEKERISKSISESAKETKYSYITNTLNSENSNISETYSTYTQTDYIYDTNFFTRNLETFTALTFLSDGTSIYQPMKLEMFPYFKHGED